MKRTLEDVTRVLNYSIAISEGYKEGWRHATLLSGDGYIVQVMDDGVWRFAMTEGFDDSEATLALVELVSGKSARVPGGIPQTVVFPKLGGL